MDYDFDFDDWSGEKSTTKHSTPARRKLEPSFLDTPETEKAKKPCLRTFEDSDDEDFHFNKRRVIESDTSNSLVEPTKFDSRPNTPHKRESSPVLFACSPKFEGPKTQPKKLIIWPKSEPNSFEFSSKALDKGETMLEEIVEIKSEPDSPIMSPSALAVTPDLSFDGDELVKSKRTENSKGLCRSF